jgi:Co/Zn/Cd efflux system component
MACCAEDQSFDGASPRRALAWVLAINLTMFLVDVVAGQAAGSQALLADALDFAGGSFTYGQTLGVISHSARWIPNRRMQSSWPAWAWSPCWPT